MKQALLSFSLCLFLAGCLGTQPPAPFSHYGEKEGAGSAGIHTISAGDTLWSLAQRYKIVMRDIAVYNKLSAPFTLNVGGRLRIPPPQEYTVKPGDTLYRISKTFNVSLSEIARLNHMRSPYVIHTGDKLTLPSLARENVQPSRKKPSYQAPSSTRVASKAPRSKITAKTPKRSSSKFLKPVEGRTLSNYGAKAGGLHNDGINIAAPKGAPVRAAENGVVAYAGNELKGSGNLVLIRHEGRWMTAYAHMDRVLIKRGQVIRRGQTIGTVGSTGSVSTPQLHFEVRRGTDALNPVKYM